MSVPHYRFGPTTVARLRSPHELRYLLDDPWLRDRTIIIKPNWVTADPGDFTDADTLRLLLEALDCPVVVTESYCLARSLNVQKQGVGFTVEGKEVDWRWLLKGDGWKWLTKSSDWDWFKHGGHWDRIVIEDKAFLDEYGFTELFNEFDVEYVNVTEEVWNDRIASPAEVKRIVESKHRPVHNGKLYGMVPEKLFRLRNATFISLARIKMYASFTIKNLFGMIPDPIRPYWHGPNNSTITKSIMDINKIYHSLFDVFGICEAMFTLPISHPEGVHEGIYSGRYNMNDGVGCVALGRNLAALDGLLLHLTDPSMRLIAKHNREPIELAEDELGLPIHRHVFDEAKATVGSWISPS